MIGSQELTPKQKNEILLNTLSREIKKIWPWDTEVVSGQEAEGRVDQEVA